MMHMFDQEKSNIMDVMRMPLIANFMIDSLTCAEHIGTICTQILCCGVHDSSKQPRQTGSRQATTV